MRVCVCFFVWCGDVGGWLTVWWVQDVGAGA